MHSIFLKTKYLILAIVLSEYVSYLSITSQQHCFTVHWMQIWQIGEQKNAKKHINFNYNCCTNCREQIATYKGKIFTLVNSFWHRAYNPYIYFLYDIVHNRGFFKHFALVGQRKKFELFLLLNVNRQGVRYTYRSF